MIRNKYLDPICAPQIVPQPTRGCHRDLFFRGVIYETGVPIIVAIHILNSIERSIRWIRDEILWREREVNFHARITRRCSGCVRSRSDAVSIIPKENNMYDALQCYFLFFNIFQIGVKYLNSLIILK